MSQSNTFTETSLWSSKLHVTDIIQPQKISRVKIFIDSENRFGIVAHHHRKSVRVSRSDTLFCFIISHRSNDHNFINSKDHALINYQSLPSR